MAIPLHFGKVPIVCGVTGHRDLIEEEIEGIRLITERFFFDLKDQYKHTPILLLSPLAEGADRLVAEIALENSISLVVPLPMPQEEYEKDFISLESVSQFRRLLQQAEDVITLPPVMPNMEQPYEAEFRSYQYGLVGGFVARHCHVLIGVWDGRPSDKVGSSAHVINLKREGVAKGWPQDLLGSLAGRDVFPRPRGWEIPNPGAIFHLPASRLRNKSRIEKTREGRWLVPFNALENHRENWRNIDNYNADLQSYFFLEGETMVNAVEDAGLNPSSRLGAIFGWADSVSRACQLRFKSALIYSILFVLAMVCSSQFDNRMYRALFLLAFLSGSYVFFKAKRLRWQSIYLDARSIAEGVRVLYFWRLCGIQAPVADHFLIKLPNRLKWLRESITVLDLYRISKENQSISDVFERWVSKQAEWYVEKIEENRRGRRKKWISYIASLSIFLALLNFLVEFKWLTFTIQGKSVSDYLFKSAAMIAAIGIAFENYSGKLAHPEQERLYERMAEVFSDAQKNLITADDYNKKNILFDVGIEALTENNDWYLLKRDRKIENPKG